MKTELIIVLAFGTLIMSVMMAVQMKWYKISLWKCIPISVILVLEGVYGSQLWYFVENGDFAGRSLYGSIFLAPIVYLPVSWILKMNYGHTLDFCVTAGSVTLGMTKLQCMFEGCCPGMVLGIDSEYHYIRFPSEIVEFVAFLMVSAILMYMSSKPHFRGKVYLWFLVIYGGARFVLNFFREIRATYVLGLSAGSFWSAIAVVVGATLLLILKHREKIKNTD